jgi:hypothetical protein
LVRRGGPAVSRDNFTFRFWTSRSTAFGNNFDLAGVFGDDLHAFATTGSNMVDILPSLFGDTAAATDIGNFLTDVLSGFTF